MFLSRIGSCRAILSVVAIGIASGCASSLDERASLAASSMQTARTEVEKVADQIEATLSALNDLVEKPQSDLKPQYASFTAALAKLESQTELARAQIDDMREKGVAYYDVRTLSSDAPALPGLKESYEKVGKEAVKARNAFNPLVETLVEIRTLLNPELSTTAVSGVKDMAKDANSKAEVVKVHLHAATAELDKIAKMIE